MRKNKKGMWFGVLLSVVVLIFISGLIGAVNSKLDRFKKTLGEEHLEIAEFYDKAQKAPFFIEKSAKPAGEQAIYELGAKGGFSEPVCGEYFGYAFWQTQEKSCYPKARTGFKLIFQRFLDEYLRDFPEAGIPTSNYNLIVTGSDKLKIDGYAMKNIIFPSKPSKYLTWKEDIKARLSDEERQCLENEGKFPVLSGSRLSRCSNCAPRASCSDYPNEDYCNLDPCGIGCGAGSLFGLDLIDRCKSCSGMTCNDYSGKESCHMDPCNFGCIWDSGSCRILTSKIWYALTPSFNAEIDYDVGIYDTLKLEAKKIIGDSLKCEKTGKELSICVREATSEAGSKLIEKGMSFMPLSECGGDNDPGGDEIYKFCVKTNKKILIYNKELEEFESKNVMIRFALYMIDLPPEQAGIELFDHLKEKQTIVVKWSKVEDAEAYNIYFSKVPFLNKLIVGGKIEGTDEREIDELNNAEKTTYIDLTRCDEEKSIIESACVYGDHGSVLIREKPYYVRSEDSYLYVVSVPEDGQYYFAVTGVDISGNENTKLTEGKNYARGVSVDDD
jgi:hypothetical protein